MEAILGTLSGANNKLLMCGNPTKTSGTFYDSHTRDRALYKCHTVSSVDSPRTNKENIDSLIRKYGWDSNVVRVRVRGEFPKQEDDVFISLSLIEQAAASERDIDKKIGRISFGVDVARYGDDETVIVKNVGGEITIPTIFRGKSLMQTVGAVVQLYKIVLAQYPEYTGDIYINIDDTGLGGGVTDRLEEVRLEERLNRMVIVPINAASRVPEDTVEFGNGRVKACDIYDNLTTYMWAAIKDKIEHGILHMLTVSKDNELIGQISLSEIQINQQGENTA